MEVDVSRMKVFQKLEVFVRIRLFGSTKKVKIAPGACRREVTQPICRRIKIGETHAQSKTMALGEKDVKFTGALARTTSIELHLGATMKLHCSSGAAAQSDLKSARPVSYIFRPVKVELRVCRSLKCVG